MRWGRAHVARPFVLVLPELRSAQYDRVRTRLEHTMPFQLQDVLQIAPHQASTCLEGTIVLLDTQRGLYYSLPEVAGVIWSLLEQPITLDELLRALQARFTVDPEVCRRDTEEFLDQLRQRGLLLVASP